MERIAPSKRTLRNPYKIIPDTPQVIRPFRRMVEENGVNMDLKETKPHELKWLNWTDIELSGEHFWTQY
jgi:hypothetical protein